MTTNAERDKYKVAVCLGSVFAVAHLPRAREPLQVRLWPTDCLSQARTLFEEAGARLLMLSCPEDASLFWLWRHDQAACTCGSGGHPRYCRKHPDAYQEHIDELNAIDREP